MNVVLSEKALTDLKEGLRRCSPETVEAAIRFRQHGDPSAIPAIVYGIIQRYLPSGSTVRVAEAAESTRLMEDLGLDSLTLLEIVLSIEEVLNIRIENEELKEIRTLGHLKQFLDTKISGGGKKTAAKRYDRAHIALVLPQQPPFLFLEEAELNGETIKAKYSIRGDEYFLEGHFKDDPVFPASIVFEAMGQAACLWVLEKIPKLLGTELKSNQVLFVSMDGAHFYRKTRPGDCLEFEQKMIKLRSPLAIFQGVVTCNGERVAKIDQLILAFGDPLSVESASANTAASPVPQLNSSAISQPNVPVPTQAN